MGHKVYRMAAAQQTVSKNIKTTSSAIAAILDWRCAVVFCTLGSPPSSSASSYDSALTRCGDPDMTSGAAESSRSLRRAVPRRRAAAAVWGCYNRSWLPNTWGDAMHHAFTVAAQCCCCLVPSLWKSTGVEEIVEAAFCPIRRAAFQVNRSAVRMQRSLQACDLS